MLITGRDIITLWVARMVMTGLYNMGRVPFYDVAINPTILDGKGERMSKQKGNGVDPVDVIDSHGADALRLTLTQMATETQDARLPVLLICPHCGEKMANPDSAAPVAKCPKCKKQYTRALGTAVGTPEAPLAKPTSDKFDAGRNFCNKLWNAARFALSNLESIAPARGRREQMVAGRSLDRLPLQPHRGRSEHCSEDLTASTCTRSSATTSSGGISATGTWKR